MSGGVDSSVTAKLLCDAGNECIGCTMKLYRNEDAGISAGHTCCSLDDVEDARRVAYHLGMAYYVFNFAKGFAARVIDPFVAAYRAGRTPNPCIECNRHMKFDKLYTRAKMLGCDYIATGHYARIVYENGSYRLKKALDPTKDQSYVLYGMTKEQLAHTLFPLGALSKQTTRSIAAEGGLCCAEKPDSQDICFVPDGDYARVIESRVIESRVIESRTGEAAVPGDFVDTAGRKIGTHRGIIHYTIGQRRGLGIPATNRLYVCGIDPTHNTVTLGPESALYTDTALVEACHWIDGKVPQEPFRCAVKIRYHQPEQSAVLLPLDETHVEIRFDHPQRAVTPGQAAVLYDGDTVLGGGVLSEKAENR